MLAINVATLLKSIPGTTRDVVIDEPDAPFSAELGATGWGPVHGTARLFRTQDGIVVWADLAVTLQFECSRCLEPVETPIQTHLEEEFRPVINIMTGAALAPPTDDALRIDERHTLDLTETARQYLLTASPLRALCSPSCRGLCQRCGANLNLGPCSCPVETPNNPFALLTTMLEAEDDGDGDPEG